MNVMHVRTYPYGRLGAMGALIALDQLTKLWALQVQSYTFTSGISCALHVNRGIAFGMLHSHAGSAFSWVLTGIIAGIMCYGMYHILKHTHYRTPVALNLESMYGGAVILLAAGAWSNMLDRLWRGGVIDFIACEWAGWSFPIFNLADVMICVGAVCTWYVLIRAARPAHV